MVTRVQNYKFPKENWTLKTARSWCLNRPGCNFDNCFSSGNWVECVQFVSSKCIASTFFTIKALSKRTANLAGRRKPKPFLMIMCKRDD